MTTALSSLLSRRVQRASAGLGEAAGSLCTRLKSIGTQLSAWAGTCAVYRKAAANYEELSALSDAELARRGLTRASLAHGLLVAADRVIEGLDR